VPRLPGRNALGAPVRPPLRPFQADGVEFLRANPHAFLADEPGLGKSRQLLEAAKEPCLVVAPAMVIDSGTWATEVGKWAPGLDVTVTAYSRLNQRVPKTIGKPPIEVLTKAGQRILVMSDKLPVDLDRDWGSVVFDEAHYLKGRNTVWTSTARQLAARSDQVHLASGTPMPNWAHELFVGLQLMYPEKARPGGELGSYWRWAAAWFDTSPTRFSGGNPAVGNMLGCDESCQARSPVHPCEHYQAFADANLGTRFLQRYRDDVLTDLPPLTEQEVLTPMAPSQAKVYRALKKDFVAWTESGTEVVAWSDAALNVKLAKCCTGLPVLTGERGSGKLDQLAADLEGRARPTLVLGHFKDTLQACAEVSRRAGATTAVIDGTTSRVARRKAVQAFQAGSLDVIVGSLPVVAEGLTLTAADMCIFVEKSYRPSTNQQAMRRIHRIGQDRPVTVRDYVTPGTVDERVRELLATKSDEQIRVLSAAQWRALA